MFSCSWDGLQCVGVSGQKLGSEQQLCGFQHCQSRVRTAGAGPNSAALLAQGLSVLRQHLWPHHTHTIQTRWTHSRRCYPCQSYAAAHICCKCVCVCLNQPRCNKHPTDSKMHVVTITDYVKQDFSVCSNPQKPNHTIYYSIRTPPGSDAAGQSFIADMPKTKVSEMPLCDYHISLLLCFCHISHSLTRMGLFHSLMCTQLIYFV